MTRPAAERAKMKTRKLGPFVVGERFGTLNFYIVWRGRVVWAIPNGPTKAPAE